MSLASLAEANNNDPHSSNLNNDIAWCEMCISLAARIGVRMRESALRAVKTARQEFTRNEVSAETESAFYSAMANIATQVPPYPSKKVADDLRHCADLVSHAAITGKPIAWSDIEALSLAREAQKDFAWSAAVEVPFYDAMSRITSAVAPVNGETVGAAAREGARKAIRNYSISAAALTLVVVALSCLLFVTNQISADIQEGIQENDPIALTMHNQLQAYAAVITKANEHPSADVLAQMRSSPEAVAITDTLEKFATNNRQLYSDIIRTRLISSVLFWLPNSIGRHIFAFLGKDWGDDWGVLTSQYADARCSNTAAADWECSSDSIRSALEVELPLFGTGVAPNKSQTISDDTLNQGFQKIALYQQIRATARYAQDNILGFVGIITGFVLPVLYAWLGATASILRKLRDDTAAYIFHPEYSKVANRSHVTTAVIVGIAIGLFSKPVHGGMALSPLAIAFVAGYASDKFFQFIDRLVQRLFSPTLRSGVSTTKTGSSESVPLNNDTSPKETNIAASKQANLDTIQAYVTLKKEIEDKAGQAEYMYSRLSTREVLRIQGIDRFAVSVFGVLAIIVWAIQLVPGLFPSLIASVYAQENGRPNSDKLVGGLKSFVPPLGLSAEVWTVMVIVIFAVMITIALAFLWKGYFAKSKSEKAANFIERFATLVLGAFLGRSIG